MWLFGYLILHADRRTGTLYRNVSTVSRDMRVSQRTVQAWLALLRQHGYVRTNTTERFLRIEIGKWRPIVRGQAAVRALPASPPAAAPEPARL